MAARVKVIDLAKELGVTSKDLGTDTSNLLVFDPAATGNVAPIRTLQGPSTTLAGDASQFPMPIVVW